MKPVILFSGFFLFALAWSSPAEAQFLKKLKKEIKDRVEDKIIKDAGDAAVKGVDKTEKAVGDAAVG